MLCAELLTNTHIYSLISSSPLPLLPFVRLVFQFFFSRQSCACVGEALTLCEVASPRHAQFPYGNAQQTDQKNVNTSKHTPSQVSHTNTISLKHRDKTTMSTNKEIEKKGRSPDSFCLCFACFIFLFMLYSCPFHLPLSARGCVLRWTCCGDKRCQHTNKT